MNALVGIFVVLSLLGVLAIFIWWLLMLIEALRIPASRWSSAGQSQILYVLAMILLGVLGTLLYVLIPRRMIT